MRKRWSGTGRLFNSTWRKPAGQEKTFQRPQVVLRHDERMLLQALLGDAEVRAEVIDALKSLETIATFPSRRIFQAMFALDANGGRFNFEDLHARLEEGDQNLLAHAVLNDDQEVSREEVMAALDSIRRTEDQHRRALLKGRIKEAERGGNWQEALRLAAELQGLEQGSRGQNQRGQK